MPLRRDIDLDYDDELRRLEQEKKDLSPAKKKKGWYGVDLDGTLAYYAGWNPQIGKPIPKMLKRVKKWLAEGKEVRIFTARISRFPGTTDEHVENTRKMIEEWCITHLGQKLQVTNVKEHDLIELWDDRAVQVVKNTGRRVKFLKKRR